MRSFQEESRAQTPLTFGAGGSSQGTRLVLVVLAVNEEESSLLFKKWQTPERMPALSLLKTASAQLAAGPRAPGIQPHCKDEGV